MAPTDHRNKQLINNFFSYFVTSYKSIKKKQNKKRRVYTPLSKSGKEKQTLKIDCDLPILRDQNYSQRYNRTN